jgi:hypothetical protein
MAGPMVLLASGYNCATAAAKRCAALGRLVIFGPIGFIFGPIVLAIFFSLIDIYQDIILEAKSL